MQDIINSITQAEERAAAIKADALEKAGGIARDAQERAADIEKLCEAECKLYREKSIEDALTGAQAMYDNEITVNRAKASSYCAEKSKDADNAVSEIVRRIMRGGC